ncbi:MAG TPA: hypothetical protein VKY85_27880 [Candidatus Angelobacter sp.]|nr:hypothetical protein [Candidatus Angelobacter sp.]
MSDQNTHNTSPGTRRSEAAKPATKIRIIEDEEATGETAAAYDF